MLERMLTGWRHFGRKPQASAAASPDHAVRGLRTWLMVAVITASSAALLGTSDGTSSSLDVPNGSQFHTTYTFERKGIEGSSVDLTADQPRATFYLNFRADDLGPEGSVSTNGANATIHATIEGSGFSDNKSPTYVTFKLQSLGMASGTQTQALDQYLQTTPLTFAGNCALPTEGDACNTSLALELLRADDGTQGGTVRVTWSFDVSATSVVPNASEESTVGPSDPPWTIEVLQ
jgi:hypothetical protein